MKTLSRIHQLLPHATDTQEDRLIASLGDNDIRIIGGLLHDFGGEGQVPEGRGRMVQRFSALTHALSATGRRLECWLDLDLFEAR